MVVPDVEWRARMRNVRNGRARRRNGRVRLGMIGDVRNGRARRRNGRVRLGMNRTEQNRTEQNRTEQNRTEQNRSRDPEPFTFTHHIHCTQSPSHSHITSTAPTCSHTIMITQHVHSTLHITLSCSQHSSGGGCWSVL